MKRILSISFVLLLSVFWGTKVSADNKFYADDVTVEPGGTVKVSVYFDNTDEEITAFNFHMYLPEGLSVVNKSAAYEKSRTNDKMTVDFTITDQEEGTYQVWWQNSDTEEYSIIGNTGVLFTFTLAAADGLAEKDYEITFAANEAYNIDLDDIEFTFTPIKVTVGAAAAETETVTLTKEYNTYVPTKALDFSGVEGIKAYYVTEVTATEATLTEATTVAAGEGIIISGTPGTYEVPVATTEVAKSTTNKLATGTIAEGDYILYDGEFVPCSGGTLPDGKAYLPKSEISTSSAKALILGFGDATGINEAKAAKADGAIYSISGVRVAQPQKGVYIMNGRKVIVK